MEVVGIDPGSRGAIALLTGRRIVQVWDMPIKTHKANGETRTALDWAGMAAITQSLPISALIALEKQWARPEQSMQSMGRMMEMYGQLWGWFLGRGFRVRLVAPQKWRGDLGLSSKTMGVELAESLYPGCPVRGARGGELDGRADAILIAHHAMLPPKPNPEGVGLLKLKGAYGL